MLKPRIDDQLQADHSSRHGRLRGRLDHGTARLSLLHYAHVREVRDEAFHRGVGVARQHLAAPRRRRGTHADDAGRHLIGREAGLLDATSSADAIFTRLAATRTTCNVVTTRGLLMRRLTETTAGNRRR